MKNTNRIAKIYETLADRAYTIKRTIGNIIVNWWELFMVAYWAGVIGLCIYLDQLNSVKHSIEIGKNCL